MQLRDGDHQRHRSCVAVSCSPTFALGRSLRFVDGFSPTLGEQTTSATTLTKAFAIGGRGVLVEVDQREAGALSMALTSATPIDADVARAIGEQVRFVLSADEDMSEFLLLAARDAAMAPIATRLAGLHHVKFPSPFECAAWGVLNQRIGRRAARAMKTSIARGLGHAIEGDHVAFPEAETVVRAGERVLERLTRHPTKAARLSAVARAFAAVEPCFLHAAPIAEVEAWLRLIPGVGDFTSSFVLFRGLGRFVRSPSHPGLVQAASRAYGRSLGAADIPKLAAPYGAWGGHWALYLWASTFDAM